jgi:hypothetical protein
MLTAYEITTTILFLAILVWGLRSRNAVYVGALAGGFMLSGFDWFWCSRAFWNATTNTNLIMVPGLDIQGVRYPLSICFVWCIGFGFLPLLASRHFDAIARRLGAWHWPVIFVVAVFIDWLIESIGVAGLGVWHYYQSPSYLAYGGVPWSNFWFLGGVLTLSYFGLARAHRWTAISQKDPTMGIFLGSSAILTPGFLLGVLQLFWWSHAHPWIESGRTF